MLDNQRERADPKAECKEIRSMLRLMRDNFERGLYEGEEYQYWQKVSGLKEKLALLERVPEPALNRAARTLLDSRFLGKHHQGRAQRSGSHHDPGIWR
jgi:hypothetical protein